MTATVTPFPARRTPMDVSALAFVQANILDELADPRPRLGEPLAEYFARRDAALDILDDLLEEFALAAEEFELLDGAA